MWSLSLRLGHLCKDHTHLCKFLNKRWIVLNNGWIVLNERCLPQFSSCLRWTISTLSWVINLIYHFPQENIVPCMVLHAFFIIIVTHLCTSTPNIIKTHSFIIVQYTPKMQSHIHVFPGHWLYVYLDHVEFILLINIHS